MVRHVGMEPVALIPLDIAAMDTAQAAGQLLRDVAAQSPARLAISELAARVAGRPVRGRRRRSTARR
ncbi:hypothetical protein FDG2_1667 [Candidatus Protofrankia californiensis]|uniref:Uncharacterized protein n=2 Tax=Protofrankia TaxID=2994361 RepID=A0A1C3NW69_9ACTN|nr:hypothetical protein FDG2_1667 [Candidatus Protofrankia californiensis]